MERGVKLAYTFVVFSGYWRRWSVLYPSVLQMISSAWLLMSVLYILISLSLVGVDRVCDIIEVVVCCSL